MDADNRVPDSDVQQSEAVKSDDEELVSKKRTDRTSPFADESPDSPGYYPTSELSTNENGDQDSGIDVVDINNNQPKDVDNDWDDSQSVIDEPDNQKGSAQILFENPPPITVRKKRPYIPRPKKRKEKKEGYFSHKIDL